MRGGSGGLITSPARTHRSQEFPPHPTAEKSLLKCESEHDTARKVLMTTPASWLNNNWFSDKTQQCSSNSAVQLWAARAPGSPRV